MHMGKKPLNFTYEIMNSEVTITTQDSDLVATILDCLMTISSLCSIAVKKAYQILSITEKEKVNQRTL